MFTVEHHNVAVRYCTMNTDTDLCSKCRAEPRRPGQRYGAACHAAYQRDWRKIHPHEGTKKQKRADA